MNVKELNEFIKDYFKKNKTRSAIMLSTPWAQEKVIIFLNILYHIWKINVK